MEVESINSRFATLCLLLTSSTLATTTGFHFVSVNPLTSVLQITFNETYIHRYEEPMSSSTWRILLSVTASVILFGSLLGGFSCNFLLRFFSNKQFLQISHVLNIIAVLIIALIGGLTGSYEAFIVGRFLTGIVCGFLFVVVPTILAEMSTRRQQGIWQSILGASLSFGFWVGAIIAHLKVLGSLQRWPVAIALAVIPSLIYLLFSSKIPDTPYYLLRQGRKDEAIKVLKMLRVNKNVEREIVMIEEETSHGGDMIGIIEILKKKQYRNQLFAVFALYGHSTLTGIHNVLLYSDLVFIKAGVSPEKATLATIGIFALQFLTACCGSKFIHIFGAWKVCIVAALLIILGLILFTVSQAIAYLAPTVMSYLAIVSVALIMITWFGGTNVAILALISEITTERTRSTCLSYGSIIKWGLSWIVGFLPPYLQISLKAYSMVIWLVCTILLLLYIVVFIPDTKGKSVEEIQDIMKGNKRNNKRKVEMN